MKCFYSECPEKENCISWVGNSKFLEKQTRKINKAVILAGGKGTRFLPFTSAVPKEMLPIIDKPVLHYIVEEVINTGIEDILIIKNPDKEVIEKYFSNETNFKKVICPKTGIETKINIQFKDQLVSNGSGSALLLAEDFLNGEPGIIINGDDLIFSEGNPSKELIEIFNKYEKTIIGVQKVKPSNISKYGAIDILEKKDDKTFVISDIIEKPNLEDAPSLYAAFGRYIITKDFFKYLKQISKAKNGEYQFTDALRLEARRENIMAYEFEGKRFDIGDKLEYLKAIVEYGLQDENLGKDFGKYIDSLYDMEK